MSIIKGACKCGNIQIQFCTSIPITKLPTRICSCTFCTKYKALSITDPNGSLEITVTDQNKLLKHQFGLKVTDFYICKECDMYISAISHIDNKNYAVANANCFDIDKNLLQKPVAVSYDGEVQEDRIARRKLKWTPAIVKA